MFYKIINDVPHKWTASELVLIEPRYKRLVKARCGTQYAPWACGRVRNSKLKESLQVLFTCVLWCVSKLRAKQVPLPTWKGFVLLLPAPSFTRPQSPSTRQLWRKRNNEIPSFFMYLPTSVFIYSYLEWNGSCHSTW